MHDEFLNALRESPNDNVSRLVYADWLDEQGDPLAEFLRLEVQLTSEDVSTDERTATMNRLAELGRWAEPGWLRAVNRSPFVRCVLQKVTGGDPRTGRLELAVYATRVLLVTFNEHLLQYLRFTITSPLGEVSAGPYASFGPLRPPQQHRFSPGERMSVRVNLLHPLPIEEIMVGTYTVGAVYDYDGVQSRTDPVRVELTDDRKRWRLGRYARE